MTYYILESPVGEKEVLADFNPYRGFTASWHTGTVFEELPPDPIELTWDPDHEAGVRVAFYELTVPLMTKALIGALRDAGVDNLETYPVVIHSDTGAVDCSDYQAVNVIGAVAAADMGASEIEDMGMGGGLGDVLFGSLVIDEAKAMDLPLFRLAECVTALVIHSRVVDELRAAGGFGLTFVEPEDYCG